MADTELVEVVQRLAVVFARRQVRYALIGGLAVGLRSRPRATKDADFILNVPVLAFWPEDAIARLVPPRP